MSLLLKLSMERPAPSILPFLDPVAVAAMLQQVCARKLPNSWFIAPVAERELLVSCALTNIKVKINLGNVVIFDHMKTRDSQLLAAIVQEALEDEYPGMKVKVQ